MRLLVSFLLHLLWFWRPEWIPLLSCYITCVPGTATWVQHLLSSWCVTSLPTPWANLIGDKFIGSERKSPWHVSWSCPSVYADASSLYWWKGIRSTQYLWLPMVGAMMSCRLWPICLFRPSEYSWTLSVMPFPAEIVKCAGEQYKWCHWYCHEESPAMFIHIKAFVL